MSAVEVHVVVVLFVLTGGYVVHPFLIVEVPADCPFYSFLELQRGFPAQLALQFAGVDSVAQVMSGAVCHIGYQVFGRAFRIAQKPVDCFDYDFYKVNVFPFVESSDIIGVGYFAFVENQVYCTGVVFNKQPVAYILSFAV